MKETLKKSSIKDKLIVFLIIFVFSLIIASIIYRYLFYPLYILNFPYVEKILPNGTEIINYYQLNITGYDLLRISLNGIIKNNNLNFSNPNESINFIHLVDNYISNNSLAKANYNLYYNQFSKIYPQYYFILCIENSCASYTLAPSGLVNVPYSYLPDINSTLEIYISYPVYYEIKNDLEENKSINIIKIFKNALENGEIKVYNTQQVVSNILYLYSTKS
ncbi:hypothetical protein YN1_0050 [Nanoarchaeota archaeon]